MTPLVHAIPGYSVTLYLSDSGAASVADLARGREDSQRSTCSSEHRSLQQQKKSRPTKMSPGARSIAVWALLLLRGWDHDSPIATDSKTTEPSNNKHTPRIASHLMGPEPIWSAHRTVLGIRDEVALVSYSRRSLLPSGRTARQLPACRPGQRGDRAVGRGDPGHPACASRAYRVRPPSGPVTAVGRPAGSHSTVVTAPSGPVTRPGDRAGHRRRT